MSDLINAELFSSGFVLFAGNSLALKLCRLLGSNILRCGYSWDKQMPLLSSLFPFKRLDFIVEILVILEEDLVV
jgi:hypothetical protein